MLKTVPIHARHVLYRRTLLRTLKAGIENTNPIIKKLSRLLKKNLRSFMRISAVAQIEQQNLESYILFSSYDSYFEF